MFGVRFLGRGGQGVVTAAELLAAAAFSEGKHAQAFPSFGSERLGAPVMSFCRIDDKPIRTHEPDVLIIQDPTLPHQAELFAGLSPAAYMLINSTHGFGDLGLDEFVTGFHRDRLLRAGPPEQCVRAPRSSASGRPGSSVCGPPGAVRKLTSSRTRGSAFSAAS
jgi:pyruvate ferredoxin oxidoreductase gamma subunit